MNPKWVTGGQVYPQIAERLRQRIAEGLYRAGSYLPSEAVLSAEFRVARNTLRRALALLENERLIATIATKGRIVLGRDAPGFNLEREVVYVSIAGTCASRSRGGSWRQVGDCRVSWCSPAGMGRRGTRCARRFPCWRTKG